MSCLFCRIAAGEVPCSMVFETDRLLAFRDIQPQAPAHLLVIPKQHFANLNELDDAGLAADLMLGAAAAAKEIGLVEGGYRVVMNCGTDGGQTVDHLHLHVLGGRPLSWPPG